jgi:hypothetical protein
MVAGQKSRIRSDGLCIIGLKTYAYVYLHDTSNRR